MKSHLENIKVIIERQNRIILENERMIQSLKTYLGK